MNSLLQTLFQIKEIPRQIYALPYDQKKDTNKWEYIHAFQKLFYNMQSLKHKPADTAGLTKAFGWNTAEVFTQQDVQEFSCILLDSFEKKAKEANVENFVQKLFKGQMENYVKCINVDYKSSRLEDFYDIQLPVKDKNTLYQSLDEYTNEEYLVEDNQYQTDDFGKQDAIKGLKFASLPPVLMLHLRRFEYDWMVDANVKINSKLEIYEDLDMSNYLTNLTQNNAKHDETQYMLFGILIHQGGAAGSGHYITYIRPEMTDWYKFNDEVVTKVNWSYVKTMSEGGTIQKVKIDPEMFEIGLDQEHTGSTAYELVYMRKSEIQNILSPILEIDIPKYIVDSVAIEHAKSLKNKFFYSHTEIFLTSPDRFQGFTGAGPGIGFKGNYDSISPTKFSRNPYKAYSYLLNNRTSLELFMQDIENRTNLLRYTYQIYKYNHKTLNWVPFLQAINVKGMKSKTVHELLMKDAKKILLIVPLLTSQIVFQEMGENCMEEERENSELLRANKLTWAMNPLEKSLQYSQNTDKENQEMPVALQNLYTSFENLKIYKNSLVFCKFFVNQESQYKSYTTISRFATVTQLKDILKVTSNASLYFERINDKDYPRQVIEISKLRETDGEGAPNLINNLQANIFTVIAVLPEQEPALEAYYQFIADTCYVRVISTIVEEGSQDVQDQEQTFKMNINLTTQEVHQFIAEKIFKNTLPCEQISVSYIFDDNYGDLLLPFKDVNTLKDMILDENYLNVKKSEFTASQLQQNFQMQFNYQDLMGTLQHSECLLICKTTTIDEFISMCEEKYEELIRSDMQQLVQVEQQFAQTTENLFTGLEIIGLELMVLNNANQHFKKIPSSDLMGSDLVINILKLDEFKNLIVGPKLRVYLPQNKKDAESPVKFVTVSCCLTFKKSNYYLTSPLCIQFPDYTTSENLCILLEKLYEMRTIGGANTYLPKTMTHQELCKDLKFYMMNQRRVNNIDLQNSNYQLKVMCNDDLFMQVKLEWLGRSKQEVCALKIGD